jgi:hemolysin-activating ACP:hemolysin acyltransferase
MPSSVKTPFESPTSFSSELETSLVVGQLMRILARTARSNFSLAAIDFQVSTPIRLSQVYVFRTSSLEPLGYVSWAYVTNATLMNMFLDENYLLHQSEWNEGTVFCIIDLVALQGTLREVLKQFSYQIKSKTDEVVYIRRRRGQVRIRKAKPRRHPDRVGI